MAIVGFPDLAMLSQIQDFVREMWVRSGFAQAFAAPPG